MPIRRVPWDARCEDKNLKEDKQTMKKILALMLALAMVFALAACGGTETETQAPSTDAPATEAPATEAPATEVPDTEVPEETLPAETEIEASSEETETEKETYKTNFRFENAEVLVTANASEAAKLPGNTEMRVEKLQPGTQEYESAKAAVEAQTGVKEGAEYLFYDVNFFADGQKMNYPDGTVTIQIQFKTEQKDSSMESQTVMHIDENSQVKDVTAPAAEGSSLSSVNFAL